MLFTLESGENRLTLGIFLPIIEMIRVAVIDAGSFSAASRQQLAIPLSTVSRHWPF
jgi:hypothetical protein